MKKHKTELVFILDRSGSMGGLETDTIGGYNAMLNKQRDLPGEAVVTTVLFDDSYELLHDRISIQGIRPITEKEYFVRGSTALLDAIGKTIHKIVNVQKSTDESQQAGKVIFVITTDGFENASREYTYEMIKKMIEYQRSEYLWEFLFLGANIDAVATAARCGIKADKAANYHADSEGTELNYRVVNEAIRDFRDNKMLSKDWKSEIDKDFKKRNKS
ncbi:MAG: vWA domain-containing protein [Saccharofermentanales bacterium]